MSSACALGIFSGKIFFRAIPESLRTFRDRIFTGGVAAVSGLALSGTYGDSSPKGRAKSTAGSFLIASDTLASRLTAWLSL